MNNKSLLSIFLLQSTLRIFRNSWEFMSCEEEYYYNNLGPVLENIIDKSTIDIIDTNKKLINIRKNGAKQDLGLENELIKNKSIIAYSIIHKEHLCCVYVQNMYRMNGLCSKLLQNIQFPIKTLFITKDFFTHYKNKFKYQPIHRYKI